MHSVFYVFRTLKRKKIHFILTIEQNVYKFVSIIYAEKNWQQFPLSIKRPFQKVKELNKK